ncbi:ATP-binding protein [Nodosilinea sp. E11]|uniref:ATP-binding protein n=1 Tax=Nodosilinea sp. E11 TaxID=3037479 RepID=UPI002934EBD8|nr:AAA family ATPase [Nodosilinea sp. E11]WOD38084.1 NACHT domain-containing protein [Nodosilinea sp. E11]
MANRRDRLKASRKGLERVEDAIRQQGWGRQSAAWYDRAHVSLATLRRFWQRIPISADAFKAICEAAGVDWPQVADRPPAIAETMPAAKAYSEVWVGRAALIEELVQGCQQGCRLLLVTGMTGIGKTALVNQLCQRLETALPTRHRVTFDDRDQTSFSQIAPYLTGGAGDLASLSPEESISAVVNQLTSQPRLLILDGLEATLEGNDETGWSEFKDPQWQRFFHRLLAAEHCQTVVLVATQEFPVQLRSLGSRYPAVWRCVPLKGLEPTEQMLLLQQLGLATDINSTTQNQLQRIGAAYEGHPLTLQIIAGEILNPPFDGNLTAYWGTYGHEIEQLERATQAMPLEGEADRLRLDSYSRRLRQIVRQRLETSFNRLQAQVPLAYRLLCLGAVYRRPVVEAFWLNLLTPLQPNLDQQQLMLDALIDRYLVEELVTHDQLHLRQHNLIRSIALSHLRHLRTHDDNASTRA